MMNHTGSHRTHFGGDTELSLQDVSFDAEEVNIHDQLPSPEEMKAHLAPTKNIRRTCLTLFCVVLIVAATLAIIGVVVTEKKQARNAAQLAHNLNQAIEFLSNHSDPAALVDENSPQFRAAKWMVYDDELQRSIPTPGDDDEWKFLQRYALVVLYYATQDDGPWLYPQIHFAAPKRHECNWNHPFQSRVADSTRTFTMGAICNDDRQVQKLIIDGNNLNGVLPPEVALLQHLTKLSLDGNELVGTIPSSFGSMTKLRSLTLTYNNLEGPLPSWLGQLTKLDVLGLANNKFHGHLPSGMAALTSLTTLALDDNHLVGNLAVISHLTELEQLYLDSNIFTGRVEPVMHLNKLQVLDISSNRLHGDVPRALLAIPNLRILDLHDNKLNGSLPVNLPHSTSLSFIALHDNVLSGDVPSTINHLSSTLKHLDLSGNQFHGQVPSTLGDLTKLEYLVLANNPHFASGPLPNLKKLTNLIELSFQDTNRTGALPHDWIGDLDKLVVLDLGENDFHGKVPSQLAQLDNLELLFLHRNELTGSLPTELAQLSSLALFAMDKNSIVGNVAPVCQLPSLQVFVSDCDGDSPEVDCPCCTTCCQDSNADCNKDLVLISYNPTWEDRYERTDYVVSGLGVTPSNHKP